MGHVGSIEAAGAPIPGARARQNTDKAAELKKACADFEAIFLSQLLRTMRRTVPKSGLLDGGLAEDIYRDMLDVEIAERMARRGGMGLGDMLYRQLSKAAGVDAAASP